MKKIFFALVLMSASLFATPLINAVLNANADKVRSLLKNGANIHKKDVHGFNALDYAIKKKLPYIAQLLYANNPNKFIFLRGNKKPIHVAFTKHGFHFKQKSIDKKNIVFGTITPNMYKDLCESYKRALDSNPTLFVKNLVIILALNEKKDYANMRKSDKVCKNFTIFTYPNYNFYKFLSRLFKYSGVPQLLFRNKHGKLIGGSIETIFFERNQKFLEMLN